MPSTQWRALGPGSILGVLRADLRKSAREVVIIGPFMDDVVAEAIVAACPKNVRLRVLTRSAAAVDGPFAAHIEAAISRFGSRSRTEVRTLDRLHAKLVLIDETIVYCGSANWFRYSVEDGLEVVLRGPVEAAPTILDEIASLWDLAVANEADTREKVSPPPKPIIAKSQTPISEGFRKETLDPIAAAKLASVKGAFVLGRKSDASKKR